MTKPDPPARMPQLRPEDFTDETRSFFGQSTGGIFKDADQNPVLRTSMNCGLEPEIFGPVQHGADDLRFTDFERTLIRATDELVTEKKLSDASWEALMIEWNEKQMLDFLFTVGCYVMVAGVMRSTGVERPPDLLELAEEPMLLSSMQQRDR